MILRDFQKQFGGNIDNKAEKDLFIKEIIEEIEENFIKDKIKSKPLSIFVNAIKADQPCAFVCFHQEADAKQLQANIESYNT
jgi:hypothetical protein